MKRLSAAMLDFLAKLDCVGWIGEVEATWFARKNTLLALCDRGLIRWCPYGKPPKYRITREGRDALKAADATAG